MEREGTTRSVYEIADNTDRNKTYKWMKNGYIKKETEGLITAAQNQSLPTR